MSFLEAALFYYFYSSLTRWLPHKTNQESNHFRRSSGSIAKQRQLMIERREQWRTSDGRQSEEWWAASLENDPVVVLGDALIELAKMSPGSQEAFNCLAYIVESGQGSRLDIFTRAVDELVSQYENNTVMTSI